MRITPLNILIVEDEAIIAMDIRLNLEELGYNVIKVVESCKGAIETIKNSLVDIVLMDITLVGENDGIDTANVIKNNYNIPVLYVTANFDINTLERIKLTEPYGYIIKPINNLHLQIAIEIAFNKHQKDQAQIKTYNNIILMIKEEHPEVFKEITNRFEIFDTLNKNF